MEAVRLENVSFQYTGVNRKNGMLSDYCVFFEVMWRILKNLWRQFI